jgi:hypothetical protein
MKRLPRAAPRHRASRALTAAGLVVALLSAVVLPSVPATAHHTTITTGHHTYIPSGWNGYKVYLSSPRHSDSGSRGECGWEENINGRHWNINAAYKQTYNTSTSARFWERKYQTKISPNSRDNGYLANRTESNNWGANVHIVTHTNAWVGCGNSANYLLVMFRSGNNNSINLKNHLIAKLDPITPGGQNSWDCDGLAECNANAAHRAYVELFFHTNTSAVNWFQNGGGHGTGVNNTWRYGYAVDDHLGYPR